MTESRWCVLLCKFSSDQSKTLDKSHYERLFTGTGTGSFNMTDFFSDMSHGQLDLTRSQVFGWFSIPIKDNAEYDSFDAKHAADPSVLGSRDHIIEVAKQTAAAQNIDLSKFAGLVICVNGPMDFFGRLGGMVAVFDSVNGLRPSVMGQEMGHGYGLDHSRQDGSTVDYMDPWDVMSTDTTPFELANAEYGSIGPGLNASNMRSRGWLDESRVWKTGSASTNTTVQLRPLHRRDLTGYLAIDFLGDYLVEYRKKERWDGGFSHSAVFVHRFEGNHSYVMAGTKGNFDLVAGDKFEFGDPNSIDIFSSYGRVEVVSIDDATGTATIQVVHRRARDIPQIYGTVIGGGTGDGGGWIIVNGHLIRIPPWDPLFGLIQQLGVYRQSEQIVDVAVRQAAQQSALQAVTRGVSALHKSLTPFRAPGAAMQKERR
jgi:hypothetical protein